MYTVKTNNMCAEYSCIRMEKTKSLLKCFISCMNIPSVQCVSYSETLQTCMCCNVSFGNNVTSTGWESYVPRPCKDVTYNYRDFQICLKYVPESVWYSQARAHCEAEGADLIRIDSLEKFEIFKEILAPFSVGLNLQVWIQAVKDEQTWRFHDGSQVPDIVSISSSNQPVEIYLRAISDLGFTWYDTPEGSNYHFMCEYYRRFQRPVPI